jgi:YVTN family beta-propeller protein
MSASMDARVGRTELAGYRLESLLGRGGMGVVYRARDLALDRDVALKLLAPHLAEDVSFRERFLTESRVAASLEHPNVVPIHDAGEIDGQLYIVMRLVVGSDLKVVLRGGSLEPARAVGIVEQIASALDAAHARGLVHRDVKPSNVLLDEHGHVYLADFGLSRYLGDAAASLGPGRSLGTADNVAPEQIRCEEVDGRTDVYALSCLLYECLAGEAPFRRGSEAATLFAQLEDPPPTLPGLEAVLPQALAKNPADRYDTCGELAVDTRHALGLEPKRNPWPIAAATIGIALIAAALTGYYLTRGGGNSGQLPGRDSLVRIDPATDDVVATIRVGQDPSAVAVGKEGVWVASRADGFVRRIDPATNAIVLATPAHGRPTELALIPDSVLVSNGPLDTNVTVIDAPTGRETNVISLARGGGYAGSAHVAAHGSGVWLAGIDRKVGRLDLTAARVVDPVSIPPPTTERADAYFSSLAVSNDAIWVLGDVNDPTLSRIDRATRRVTTRIRLPFAPKKLAVGLGSVWVTSQIDDTVARIDTATARITGTVHVGRGASGLATGAGSVWVANEVDNTVSRIDPETLRILDTIDVGGSPDHIAVGDGAVWVTTHDIGDTVATRNDDTVDIGILTACEGNYGFLSDISNAGAELPLLRRGGVLVGKKTVNGVRGATVVGKKIKLHFGCGDDSAEKALSEARRLVEQVGVDILIGPTQISEGLAIRDYARTQPGITFLNGTGAGQAITLDHAAPNFFRFSTDGAQDTAGLGTYAYKTLGWRNVVTVGDDEAFNYTEVAGFAAEFCALGGTIERRVWVPLTSLDYGLSAARVPRQGVDGFFMAGSAATTLGIISELPQLHGNLADRVILTILSSAGGTAAYGKRWKGVVVGTPVPLFNVGGIPPTMPAWGRYVKEFGQAFPALALYPLLFSVFYTDNMEAALEALESVDGDLSDGQRRFRKALANVHLASATGPLRLDGNRQAVGQSFLNRYETATGGRVAARMFKVTPSVDQAFGGYFTTNGAIPSRTSPPCVKRTPPPWAR